MLGAYSPCQKELFDRVLWMRETKGLTFKGIPMRWSQMATKHPEEAFSGLRACFLSTRRG